MTDRWQAYCKGVPKNMIYLGKSIAFLNLKLIQDKESKFKIKSENLDSHPQINIIDKRCLV